jgi:NDP-sugar pyrophosphorylase family protein
MNRVSGIILAAGAGRRLGELGRTTSKAMVPVLGRPLVQWVVERLRASGVHDFVVVAHESDIALHAFVEQRVPEARIVCQRERRGIADAVVQALPEVEGGAAYLACACDSLFESADIRRLIEAGREDPEVAVVGVQAMGAGATSTRSAVEVRAGFVERLLEKPPPGTTSSPLVALPLYWLTPALEPHLRGAALVGGERHVSTALNEFIGAGGRVRALTIERRTEITTAADIARAEAELRRRNPAPEG